MKTILLTTTLITALLSAEGNQETASAKVSAPVTQQIAAPVLNTSWVDQKIEEIKPQRHGMSSASLARLKSPFIVIRPEVKEQKGGGKSNGGAIKKSSTNSTNALPLKAKRDMSKEPLTLQVVLNSSALVNGKWLKENDTFRGYKLTQIDRNYIVLERKNKKVKLFIAQKSKNINISTK